MSFQEGIDRVLSEDAGVDIAVFILWSRLGTPIGPSLQRADGSEYRSGTERELALMLEASRMQGGQRPHLLAYTRQDEASFEEALRGKSTDQKSELLRQKLMVERFIQEEFHDASSGTNVRAYHTFNRPQAFAVRFRAHLQELIDGICTGSASKPNWDIEAKGPPFRGLEAFDFDHADVFFGREDEVSAARTLLADAARRGSAFLLITGASGTGKSSLASAGLAPEIVTNEIDETVCRWVHVKFSPSDIAGDFAAGVARILSKVVPGLADRTSVEELAHALARDPVLAIRLAIIPALRAAVNHGSSAGTRLLVIVDQLEEVFSEPSISDADRTAFAAIMRALATSGQVWVVATLRGDWYPRFLSCSDLVALKGEGAQLDVVPPDIDAVRRMIESPASASGLEYEQSSGRSLADQILRDVAGRSELLPLLEDFLRELFERRSPRGTLTFSAFESLGGIEGSLARRAESSLASLSIDAQLALPHVLGLLINPGTGDSASPLRRWVPLDRFPEGSAARALVDKLIAGRLAIASARDGGSPEVAIAHEAIPRVWPRAAVWLRDNADFLRTRDRLTARMSDRSPLDESDPLVPTARAILQTRRTSLDPALARYLDFQLEAVDGRRVARARQRRRVLVGLSTLSLVALVTAGVALWQWTAATKAKIASDEAAIRANRARSDAEELVAFMTEDMAKRLETAGRSDLWGYMMKELVAYHDRRLDQLVQDEHERTAEGMSGWRQRAIIKSQLGDLFLAAGRLEDAKVCYDSARGTFEMLNESEYANGDLDCDLAIIHLKLGKYYIAAEDLNNATVHAEHYLALSQDSDVSDPEKADFVADAQVFLGHVLLERGERAEAQQHLVAAANVYESLAKNGANGLLRRMGAAEAESMLGAASLDLGDAVTARRHYEAALKNYEAVASEDAGYRDVQMALLGVRSTLGRVLMNQGELAAAADHFSACISLLEASLAPEEQRRNAAMALCRGHLGEIAKMAKDLPLAVSQFEASLAIENVIVTLNPEDSEAKLRVVRINEVLGDILMELGNVELAKFHYERSMSVIDELASQSAQNAELPRLRAGILRGLAAAAESTTDLHLSRKYYRDSLAILEDLAKSDTNDIALLQDLAKGDNLLGDLELMAGQLEAAREYFEKATTIHERLAAQNPDDRVPRRALVFSAMRMVAASGACQSAEGRAQLAKTKNLATSLFAKFALAEDKELLIHVLELSLDCHRQHGEEAAADECERRIAALGGASSSP
jgi:tetratricopeptide (TPR) repeat protein